jgi:AP-3 complex subunit beta
MSCFLSVLANSSLDPGLKLDLIPLLSGLLMDKVPSVLARALSAWDHVCPERTDLLHRPYRQICRLLIEMDEWGQLVAMRVLTIYVRRCFNKPDETPPAENNHIAEFYEDNANISSSLDPDLVLLYKSALQLVHSRSNAVFFRWNLF